MAIIAQDQYVELEYRLHLDNGEWVRGSDQETATLTFVAGCGELLPGLERRLWGLQEGDAVEFVVPAGEAFGAYDPELIQEWSRKAFPPEMELQPGQQVLPANLPFPPEFPLRVKEVGEDKVILDLNHPFSGHDLNYAVRVVAVRPATPEELGPRKQCQSCCEEMTAGT
ncbi:MAG: peptidylprolyl isomerase [Deltaproteobacteria bacterium]|nr:peptidylprolyl isomerase [Deltaproteobacteria bacterium]